MKKIIMTQIYYIENIVHHTIRFWLHFVLVILSVWQNPVLAGFQKMKLVHR